MSGNPQLNQSQSLESNQSGQNNVVNLPTQMYLTPSSQSDHLQGGHMNQSEDTQPQSVFDHRKRPLNDVNDPSTKRSHLDTVNDDSTQNSGMTHDPSVVGTQWPIHADYRTQSLTQMGNGLDSGLTGEDRHEYYPDFRQMGVQVPVPVGHPLDAHMHPLAHEGMPPHLMVAPMPMGSMSMPYAMPSAPADAHSPKARSKPSKALTGKHANVSEPNFIFLVPAVAGRPPHLAHAIAFGKCHYEGRCSVGCQKFKPQQGSYDVCLLCGHDEGFHEQLFREDDPAAMAMMVAEHGSTPGGGGGFAVAPRGPQVPGVPGPSPSPALTAAQANAANGLRSKRGPYNVKERKKDKREDREGGLGGVSALNPEAQSDAKARRQTEKYLHVLTLRDLAEKCRQLGVSPHGTKDKLVQRLLQAGFRHHKKKSESEMFAYGEFSHGVPQLGVGLSMGGLSQGPLLLDPALGMGVVAMDHSHAHAHAHSMGMGDQSLGGALPAGYDVAQQAMRAPALGWAGVAMAGMPPGSSPPAHGHPHPHAHAHTGMAGVGVLAPMAPPPLSATGAEGEGAGAGPGVGRMGELGAHTQSLQLGSMGASTLAPSSLQTMQRMPGTHDGTWPPHQ